MIFSYRVNRFLTITLFCEIFTEQNSNFQGENCPKKCSFWSNSPPPPLTDAQCRFLLEVKQMPQWVVSSEVLTTHKVWGKVLFDHFEFCSILSNIGFKSYKLIGNSYKTKCVGVQYCQKITKPCLCGMWQIWVIKVKTNYFTIRKSAPQGFRPEGEIPRRHSSNSRVY